MFSKLLGLIKPKSPETLYNQSLDLYDRGRYDKALKTLRKAIKQKPDLAIVHYTQGLCHEKLGDLESAKKAFQTCLQYDPQDQDCLYNLARILYNQQELETAMAYAEYADSLVEDPGDDQIAYLLGLIYEEIGDHPLAIAAYKKSLAINPEQIIAGLFLGKLYLQLQQVDEAIDLLRQLAESDPGHLEVNYELAMSLAKKNQWEEAIGYFQRVIEIDSTYITAYNQLGLCFYCTDRLPEAVDCYERALSFQPDYATVINNLAYTYEKMKQYDKAIEKFKAYRPFVEDQPGELVELDEHILLLEQKLKE